MSTDDIKPDWLNLVRRMQSMSRKQSWYAIITVSIVVSPDGVPQFFTEPEITKLEPRQGATRFLTQLISGMKKG